MRRLRSVVLLALVSQIVTVHGGNGPIFSHGFEGMVPLITVHWDGEGDGINWADPVNWVGDQLPQDGNAVVINDPSNPTVIYDASLGTTHLHSLDSSESLSLTGGALEFNSLTWSLRTLIVGAGTSITVFGAFQQSGGTVTGEGTLTVQGLFSWLDGNQFGAGETVANGGMALGGASTVTQSVRTLTLNGASTWTAGRWNVQHGAMINNNADFDIQFDEQMNHITGANTTFTNGAAGVLTKSAGGGEMAIETNFVNDGTVNANAGTLTLGRFNATGDSTGDFVSAPGAILALEGNLTMLAGSSFTGAGGVSVTNGGTVVIQGGFAPTGPVSVGGGGLTFDTALVTLSEVTTLANGVLTVTSDLAVTGGFQHNNGTVTGPGTITVDGLYTWLDGNLSGTGMTVADGGMALGGAAAVTQSTRTLTLNGASTWTAGRWNVQHGAMIINNAAFDIQFDEQINHITGTITTFTNGATGILTKSAGAGETAIETEFDNDGTVNVDSGTLAVGRTSVTNESTGDFVAALNATLRLMGDHTLLPASTISGAGGVTLAGGSPIVIAQGSFTFTGPLLLSNGTLNVDTSPLTVLGAFNQSGGTLTGTGQMTIAGLFTWLDGNQFGAGETVANGGMALGGASTVTQSVRTLTLNGASTWTAGRWNVQHGAIINNNAAFDIQFDEQMNHITGANTTFTNGAAGVLTKSAGGGEMAIETNFVNEGTVNANAGTLTLGRANATGDSTGDFVSTPGAILALEGNLTMLAGSSFTGAGAVSVTNGGTVVIQGGFAPTGPVSVSGGGLTFDTALVTLSEVTTLANGVLTVTSDLAVTGGFQHNNGTVTGPGTITVAGLFTWLDGTQSGTGTTIANGGMALGGAAVVTQSTRTLTLNGASAWTAGRWNVQHGATINNNAAFDIQIDEQINHVTGTITTFTNGAAGVLTKSAGVGETAIETEFDNDGTVNVDSGTLAVGRTSVTNESTGDFVAALNATLRLMGDHTLLPASTISGAGGVTLAGGSPIVVAQGSFTFTGPLQLSAGTLNVDTSPLTVLGAFNQSGGTLTGTGQLTIAGLFTWLNGNQFGAGETVADGGMALGGASAVTQSVRTLTLNGPSTWTEGRWNVQHGAMIDNNAAFDIQTDEELNHVTGVVSAFINNDALTKSAGASDSRLEIDFTNHGSITVDSGSISFARMFTQTGTGILNVGIASMSDFDSFAISQAATLGGTLEITLLGGFVPTIGQNYTIMTFASRMFMFDFENGLIFNPGTARFDITYSGIDVELLVVADP